MKLTGKLTKNSNSLNGNVSPRSGGGGRVQDVTYNDVSVVNEQGVAVIPPYPVIPPIPVKGVVQGETNLVDNNGIARIPEFPEVHQTRFIELANAGNTGYLTGNIPLNESITNFDMLIFNCCYNDDVTGVSSGICMVNDFINRFSRSSVGFYPDYSPAWYCDVKYVDNTHIQFGRDGACHIISIYGIKF